MCPVLVLGPVRGVAEGLGASGKFTVVRLLSRVRAQVGLQVLQPGVCLVAALELKMECMHETLVTDIVSAKPH